MSRREHAVSVHGWIGWAYVASVVLAGAVAALAAGQFAAWRTNRDERALWLGAAAAAAAVLLVVSTAAGSSVNPATTNALVLVRAAATSLFLLTLIPLAQTIAGGRRLRWWARVLAAVVVVRLLAILFTHRVYEHQIVNGLPHYGSGFAPASIVVIAAVVAYIVRLALLSRPDAERLVLFSGVVASMGLAVWVSLDANTRATELLVGYVPAPVFVAVAAVAWKGVAAQRRARQAEAAEHARLVELFGSALRLADLGTYTIDLSRRRINLSAEMARMYGLTEEPIEFDLDEYRPRFYHPDGREEMLAAAEAAYATGETLEIDAHVVRADGELMWTRTRSRAEGNSIIGMIQNIQDQKLRELELARQASLLRWSNELARVATFVVDARARTFTLSAEMAAMFGLEAEAVTMPIEEYRARFYHPDELHKAAAADAAYEQGESFFWESRIVRADGATIWVQARSGEQHPESRDGKVFGVAQDITDLHAMHDQLRHAEKTEALGQLAGTVAHDFGNILLVARAYAEFGLKHQGTPRLETDLAAVIAAVDDGAALTSQLLTFAQAKPVEPERVDLNDVVDSFVGGLATLLGRHIELVHEKASDRLPVLVDPRELQRALLNLGLNARDAIQRGGTVTIGTVAEHGEAIVRVADTGSGMPEEVAERIFEPFFTTKASGAGTGLGLPSTRRIVETAGGTIGVTSETGVGTTFTIRLPLASQ